MNTGTNRMMVEMSLNFASNVKRIKANQLTFIPPEFIRKPKVFRGKWKLIILLKFT